MHVIVSGSRFLCKEGSIRNFLGKEIVFEESSSEFKGKTYRWINDFMPSDTTADQPYSTPSVGAPAAPRPPAPTTDPLTFLPMTSNLVAHAIAAGLVKEPGEIHAWAAAAMAAAKTVTRPASEDFDDDIPF